MERKSKKNVASSLTMRRATWTLSSLSELLMPRAADELRTVSLSSKPVQSETSEPMYVSAPSILLTGNLVLTTELKT